MSKKLLNLCMVALLSVVSTAAWALSETGGVYQIGTAEDFNAFAALVNGGEVNARAELTADIDLGTSFTMVGTADTQGKRYDGTFDGKGHTIKYALTTTESTVALFRYFGWRGIIQNLKVEATINTNNQFAAGIAGKGRGIVRDCYVDVNINSTRNGDATDGGVVAIGYSGTIVENTLVKIQLLGENTQNCGGVVGWAENPCNIVNCLVVSDGSSFDISNGGSRNIARNDSRVKAVNVETYNQNIYGNRPGGACYNNYVTNQWGNNEATTVVPLADLADGKICYQLNNDQSRIAWVQTIGTDPFPVPAPFGSGQVYCSIGTGCNGIASGDDVTYSNTQIAAADPHQFDMYGICSACGMFNLHYWEFDDPTKFDQTDRAVFLKSVADFDVAEGMNRICNGFKLNMKLDSDLEFNLERGKYLFNNSDWIDGNFDGQGHTITIAMTDMGDRAALFPEMAGNVENLILHGSISTSGARCGSLCGEARMALIRNVFSDVNITSTRVGDNTSGGLCGWMGQVEKRVENVIYAGNFALPGSAAGAKCARIGGFTGWTDKKTFFTNCAVLGNITGAGNQTLDTDTENSQNIGRNPNNVVTSNVYVLNPISGNAVTDHDKYIHYENTEGVANGELAFLLNGEQSGLERFYQLIGTDKEPMPIAKEGALVYAIGDEGYRCDGKPLGNVSYSNTEPSDIIPGHQFVDGICTVCGTGETDEDGYLKIVSPQSLVKFSELVNGGQTDLKARMYADINMDGVTYTTAGSRAILFTGEFDGQGHHISNLTINSNQEYTGLIGGIGNGADIKNFVLDANCSINGAAYVGIIGGTNGSGSVYITNVGNEGTVTGSGVNASGIIGVDMGGSMDMFITNCYVTGAITGSGESATICSWSSANSVVKNCYSTATLSGIYGTNSFTRGYTQIVNCYEIDSEGKQNDINKVTAEEVANGALCFKLGEPFGQELGVDAHPVFEGPAVYAIGNTYTNLDLSTLNIETALGDADIILPAKKYGGAYDAYTYVAQADYQYGDWNTSNPNYNVIVGTPAEQNGKSWFTPGYEVANWNYGQDLPEFGNGDPADVYALRFFTVEGEIPSTLYMPAPHDDAPCEYYINGELIWSETDGWYEDEVVRLTDEQKALIKTDGKTVNVFAFHVHQNWGGRYADGGLYNAGNPVDAFNNDVAALDATIALAETEGIDEEVVAFAKAKSNYRGGMSTGLAQLRKARRLAFDARTEDFTGSEPADGMIAYILNVGAKMFLAGGNNWGTHASLNHMGAKCVLHANSSGENRYTIQTNLPNGTRGVDDGLSHGGYIDGTGWNTTGANWAWEIEPAGDNTYRIINCENSGDNIYLGMTDDERLQVDTDKAGADNEFNKWIFVTPEEFLALAENATPEAPVDLGHLVHQATFSQNDFDGNDKWASNCTAELGDSKWDRNAGGIWGWKENWTGDMMFEMWNTKDVGKVWLVQEVEGLPAGKYTVQMNGYYRDGNFESADEGNVRQLAYLFAGSEENCVPLASIVDGSGNYPGYGRGGASGIVIPDGCGDAARFFQVGTYVNTIEVQVGVDGKLKIGIFRNAEDVKGGDWITTDNWRLYYQGRSIDATITEAGYATFVAPWNISVIPEGVEASAAQVNKNKEGFVHLEGVTAIPAGEAVVLKGAEGTYTFFGTSDPVELGADNDLVAATAEVEADGTQYILAVDEEGAGFAKATPATLIAAGKGYLVITESGAKPFYPFGDSATGIAKVENSLENAVIYNVAGQRLQKMQKGVYIVNGKKIAVK